MWVACLHKFGSVHSAMITFTDLAHSSDEAGYAGMGRARRLRDLGDLTKVLQWFEGSNPFHVLDNRLHSLSTGEAASDNDGINCDKAEDVGHLIMKKMDNLPFSDIVLKKIDRAKTLSDVNCKGSVGKKKLSTDSTILFSRLLIIMQRSPNMEPYFSYELTSEPSALFKDGALRKADKSVLARELKKSLKSDSTPTEPKKYVIDGGWLLHRVKWQKGFLYSEIINQYVDYVTRHYGVNVVIVFDGYGNGPSIKDHEHDKRSLKASPDVVFDEGKPCIFQQSAFLANEMNKKYFVNALISHLNEAGHEMYQALNDADTLIVKTALAIATTEAVTVVANDTDVLVLLIYHFKITMSDIFVRSEDGRTLLSCSARIRCSTSY